MRRVRLIPLMRYSRELGRDSTTSTQVSYLVLTMNVSGKLLEETFFSQLFVQV